MKVSRFILSIGSGRSLAHRGYGPLIAESEDKVNDAVQNYLMDDTSILYDEECCNIFIDESTFDWEVEFGSSKFHKAKTFLCNVFYVAPISRTIYFTLEKPNDFID